MIQLVVQRCFELQIECCSYYHFVRSKFSLLQSRKSFYFVQQSRATKFRVVIQATFTLQLAATMLCDELHDFVARITLTTLVLSFSSITKGTGAVALATLVALGALSPPVLLTRKIHKYHKHHTFSVSKRRLWILGGASLGVLALPVLSAWGVYRTVVAATRKAEEILHRCLPANDDDDFSHQTFKVDTNALGLYRDGLRDATGDKNANDHIKPQLKQIETTPES